MDRKFFAAMTMMLMLVNQRINQALVACECSTRAACVRYHGAE